MMMFHLLLLPNSTSQPWVEHCEAALVGEDLVEPLDVDHGVEALLGLHLGQAVEEVENRLLSYPVNLLLRRKQFVVGNVRKDIALAEKEILYRLLTFIALLWFCNIINKYDVQRESLPYEEVRQLLLHQMSLQLSGY